MLRRARGNGWEALYLCLDPFNFFVYIAASCKDGRRRKLSPAEEEVCLEIVFKDVRQNCLSFTKGPKFESRLAKAADILGFDLKYLQKYWKKDIQPVMASFADLNNRGVHFLTYLIEKEVKLMSQINWTEVARHFPPSNKLGKLKSRLRREISAFDGENPSQIDAPIFVKLQSKRSLRLLHLFEQIVGLFK